MPPGNFSRAQPPKPLGIFYLLTPPHPLGIFIDHRWGGMDIFWNNTLHKSGFAEPFSVFFDNSFNIKLVFSSFEIGSLFSVKDLISKELKSCVVYRFRCAGCGACYVGETSRHICTHINEHLNMDKASHIFKHLQDSPRCRALCSSECFVVIDQATTRTQLKIKEAVHIHWEKSQGAHTSSVCLCSKYKEMYGRILKSLNIVNLYRGMSKLKLKIIVKVPQLLCIVVSVALNGEFERFGGFCVDCCYTW